MDYFNALIYGIVQGVTEFLPVSSSAHLAILPKLNNWQDPGVIFDLSMHLGTAFAIIYYYRVKIISLFRDGFSLFFKKEVKDDSYFFVNLGVATITTFILVLILKDFAFGIGRNLSFILFNLIIFAIIMYFADRSKVKSQKSMRNLSYKDAICVGFFQAFAIFPGVSRSGITMSVSRFSNYSREESASFSFLLSLPIILAGFVYELPKLMDSQVFSLQTCFFGIIISFVIGLLTIHFFLKFIAKIGLFYFSLYRIILAIALWTLFQ